MHGEATTDAVDEARNEEHGKTQRRSPRRVGGDHLENCTDKVKDGGNLHLSPTSNRIRHFKHND